MAHKITLMNLPVAPRYFWTSLDVFLGLAFDPGVHDRNFDGTNEQKLTPNKVLALALNELAVDTGRGWFWHLPSRNSSSHEKADPASRTPSKPSALYPAMVYVDHAWSDDARASFLASSHQFRLASSDFHLNFQRGDAPLHRFQVVSDRQYAAYAVPPGSHVILATPKSLYLVPIADYERIAGRWPAGKAPPRSADPELRLDNVGELWREGLRDPRCQQLEAYKVGSLEELYADIVRRCDPAIPQGLPTTASQVRQAFPRPANPETAIPLGTPLAATRPSRRGARKRTMTSDKLPEAHETV